MNSASKDASGCEEVTQMKLRLCALVILSVGLLVISRPTFAHHAWHGYDMSNLTTVRVP